MTAVFNIVIPALAGVSILAAVFFAWRALDLRSRVAHQTYGVGRQETRQTMQVNFIRGLAALFVSLILLGVWGLSPSPAEVAPVQTNTPEVTTTIPATAAPTATATATPTEAVETALPTETSLPVVLPTATSTPIPTDTPTPEPATATVSSGVGVWLRAAPSAQAEQLEWVPDGTVLTLLSGRETAEDFEWQQVRTPGGNEGWVAVPFITYGD